MIILQKTTALLASELSVFFEYLKDPFICFLEGPLGSGKTSLLKIKYPFVESPSYDICHSYSEFLHLDLYRINSSSELFSLGIEEYGQINIFVEWGLLYVDFFKDYYPNYNYYVIEISFSENQRTYTLSQRK